MLKPSINKSREYMPVFGKEGAAHPTEKEEKRSACTDAKLKLQVGIYSIGETDVKVMIVPPPI
jgi:hypothetical protein